MKTSRLAIANRSGVSIRSQPCKKLSSHLNLLVVSHAVCPWAGPVRPPELLAPPTCGQSVRSRATKFGITRGVVACFEALDTPHFKGAGP